MDLIRGARQLRARHFGSVVTIGSFDGLHRGHQALIARCLELAQLQSRPALCLSFEPLPREFMGPATAPARLTNFRERWRLLERWQLDGLCILRFDAQLREQSGAQFADLLSRELRAVGVVVGHDFRCGRQGDTSASMLEHLGRARGLAVDVVAPVTVDGQRVSSSAVRAALQRGEFAVAAKLLGRPYRMRGRVVRGQQLGRTLGFPTANVRLKRHHCPLQGIFAVWACGVDSRPRAAVASLGTRPTVGGTELLLETFVFDFAGDLYGRELEIEFVARLRDEQRFDNLDAMVAQMHIDARMARDVLAA